MNYSEMMGYSEDEIYEDECEILVEIIGLPGAGAKVIGTCRCGRPVYRSHMAGTIYHATEDGHNV